MEKDEKVKTWPFRKFLSGKYNEMMKCRFQTFSMRVVIELKTIKRFEL